MFLKRIQICQKFSMRLRVTSRRLPVSLFTSSETSCCIEESSLSNCSKRSLPIPLPRARKVREEIKNFGWVASRPVLGRFSFPRRPLGGAPGRSGRVSLGPGRGRGQSEDAFKDAEELFEREGLLDEGDRAGL